MCLISKADKDALACMSLKILEILVITDIPKGIQGEVLTSMYDFPSSEM
jgi:hypothetical protein